MRRSLHHLRKEYQHYEVSFYVPNPTFKGLMRFRQSLLFSSSLKKTKGGMLRQGASITAFLLLLLLFLPLLSSPVLTFSRGDVRDTSRGQNIGVLSWPP